MPEPTTPPDYSNKTKAELLELLLSRDATLAEIFTARDREEQLERARAEERAKNRAAKTPKHLGKIDVYDTDEPEDVLARASAIRAGKIPASAAKRFRTDARLRAPRGSGLAHRLGARDAHTNIDVPLGTEFDREEVPAASIDAWAAVGGIVPIG